MRIEVSGLELGKAICPGLGLAMMSNALLVGKPARDLIHALVSPAGVEPNVYDQSLGSIHQGKNLVQCLVEFLGADPFEFGYQQVSEALVA